MSLIVSLSRPEALRKVRKALAREDPKNIIYQARVLTTWNEVRELVFAGRNGAAILDPYFDGHYAGVELTELRRSSPALSMILYGDFAGQPAKDILQLATLNPIAVITLGIDDTPSAIIEALRKAPRMNRLEQLCYTIWGRFAPEIDRVLQGLILGGRSLHVPELVNMYGGSRRSLERQLRKCGLPSPERLLMWGRILLTLQDYLRTSDDGWKT